jgi:hypothetical protein
LFDAYNYNRGGASPSGLSCRLERLHGDGFETEDTALLRVDFGGVPWTTYLTWAARSRSTCLALTDCRRSIAVENDTLHRVTDDGCVAERLVSGFDDSAHAAWFAGVFEDFRRATRDPNRREALLQEALVTSLVAERAYTSARRGGEWLAVPLLLEYLQDGPADYSTRP